MTTKNKHIVTLFPGDGVGPELVECLKDVFNVLNVNIDFETYDIGQNAFEKYGVLIPEEAIASLKRNKVGLKAPVTTPIGQGFKSVNVQLRQIFDLYINLRPAKTLPHTLSKYQNIDLITFRENTEDLYIGEEKAIDDGFEAIKRITKKCSERIIKYAFDYALKNNRKKLTCIHKANILKQSDGLFLQTFNEIKKQYPSIVADDKIVDNICMQLVLNPERFDCFVAPNLYGDIITDLIAGLIGGLGMAPAANIGDDVAIFEAVHGSAPDIAGKGIVNPTAFFLSAIMMLEYLKEDEQASIFKRAIIKTLEEGIYLTSDLGGNSSTKQYSDRIIYFIQQNQ